MRIRLIITFVIWIMRIPNGIKNQQILPILKNRQNTFVAWILVIPGGVSILLPSTIDYYLSLDPTSL